jgi:hypothetical protein
MGWDRMDLCHVARDGYPRQKAYKKENTTQYTITIFIKNKGIADQLSCGIEYIIISNVRGKQGGIDHRNDDQGQKEQGQKHK